MRVNHFGFWIADPFLLMPSLLIIYYNPNHPPTVMRCGNLHTLSLMHPFEEFQSLHMRAYFKNGERGENKTILGLQLMYQFSIY